MARSGLWTGFIRGTLLRNYSDGEWGVIEANNRGHVCLAQALPQAAESNRRRESWLVQSLGGQNIIDVNSTPAAGSRTALSLYNFEPPLGKAYIIEAIGIWVSTVTTATTANAVGAKVAIYDGSYRLGPGGIQSIIVNTYTPVSLSGNAGYTGRGVFITEMLENNASTIASSWHNIFAVPWAINSTSRPLVPPTSTVAPTTYGQELQLNGRYTVPPGGVFMIIPIISPGVSAQVWAIFHETPYVVTSLRG